MQVLIIKTSSMGDILHTLPALSDALYVIPKINFDWVVEDDFSQIPTWHPAVKNVIPVAIRRWRKNWFATSVRKERHEFKLKIQRKNYDAIIDAQGLIKSAALITRIAKGKKHGLNYKSVREPIASFFYHHKYRIDRNQHAVERIRQLFAISLGYKIPYKICNYAISNYFSLKHIKKNYLVFIHATTSPSKHWPDINWQALIDLVSKAGYTIKLFWGTEHDRCRAEKLAKIFNTTEVLPYLTLSQLAVQLAGAKAIVSIDTGLSHLAAALGCPNLTLYGPTNPLLVGNYGYHQWWMCAKDGYMENITVNHVWKMLQLIISMNYSNNI